MDTIIYAMFLLFVTGSQGHVCELRSDVHFGGLLFNCSGRNLSSIPEAIPHNVVALDLSFNSFTRLVNNALIDYPLLVYLNFDDNSISQMESDAFKGVSHLSELHLSWNKLSDNEHSFPEHVFRYLNNLQVLTLEMNSMTSYPDWVFPSLGSLRRLYIDSVPVPIFGPGFKYLEKLTFLQIDSGSVHDSKCFIQRLRNETFEVFRNISIETLNIDCPSLMEADSGLFQPFLSLTSLSFSRNCLGVDANLEILRPFVGRKIQRLEQRNILPALRSPNQVHLSLTAENTKYLRDICVKEFIFNQNHLIFMESGVLMGSPFSSCVQHIDLSDNNFLGDERNLLQISLFPELRYFSVRRARTVYRGVSYNYMTSKKNVLELTFIITLPANLQYLDLSGIAGAPLSNHYNVRFANATNVKTFLFSNNYNYLQYGFTGLENVEELDMSGSRLDVVNSQLFKSFPNIRNLYVRACNMRFDDHAQLLFENLNNLERIDISENMLTFLPTLPNPSKVKQINVSLNAFDHIPITLDEFTNLTILDLSFNLITYLSSGSRNELDKAYTVHNVQLILHGNIFSCGCDSMEFIMWLVDSQVIYDSNRNFSCLKEDGTRMGSVDVARDYVSMSRQCHGRYILSYVITCLTIFLGTIATGYFVAKNPERYRQMFRKICGFGPREFKKTDFRYHLYVAYCETDIPFVFRNVRRVLELGCDPIRLFLMDRDVLPGVDIVDGVVVGVNGSFKSLLVVSRDFLKDRWCQFTVNVVVNSMTPLIPNRTILLILEDVELAEIPEALLNAVDEDFVLYVKDYFDKASSLCQRIRELACV